MPKYLIIDHDRAWDYTKSQGIFVFKYETAKGTERKQFGVGSADEFALLTAFFKEPRVYFYSDDDRIGTDPKD